MSDKHRGSLAMPSPPCAPSHCRVGSAVRAQAARRGAAWLLAASLALASACTAGHSSLGTSASPCFKALPLAKDAVHNRGSLIGVRRVPARSLGRTPLRELPSLQRLGSTPVCLVAFRGPYPPGGVDHALHRRGGRFAVVIVNERGDRVLASFVFDRIPFRFRHLI
jgi:hypothetical protein